MVTFCLLRMISSLYILIPECFHMYTTILACFVIMWQMLFPQNCIFLYFRVCNSATYCLSNMLQITKHYANSLYQDHQFSVISTIHEFTIKNSKSLWIVKKSHLLLKWHLLNNNKQLSMLKLKLLNCHNDKENLKVLIWQNL